MKAYLGAVRIAINTRFLLSEGLEGMGRYTHELMRRLVKLCPDDEFIFLFDRPFDSRYIYSDRVKGIKVSPPARHALLWYWWFEQAVPKILKREKADLFISMDGYCSLNSTVKTLMIIHDLAYLHYPDQVKWSALKYYQRWIPKYCKRADQLVTISKASQKDIQTQFQIPSEKIGIVPNGFNPRFQVLSTEEKQAAKTTFAEGKSYFCCLGAIHPRKNIEGTIRAFNQYKTETNSEDQLLIVGRLAWKSEEVGALQKSSPFSADIKLLGYQPDENVRLILGAAKALLFLSFFEGFGVPLLEAMQLQVPSIYGNQSAMPEVAGDTGLSVNLADSSEIVEAMKKVENLAADQLQTARELKLTEYTWDNAALRLKAYVDAMR